AVAAVSGIPLVGARHRAGGRQGEAGGRGVGAVAVDCHRLRVLQNAVEEQREGDGAGWVIAARQRGRVRQDRGRGIAQGDDGGVGGGGVVWLGRAAPPVLFVLSIPAALLVFAVAAVGGIPLVGARHRARRRQREAGRRRVQAVAV